MTLELRLARNSTCGERWRVLSQIWCNGREQSNESGTHGVASRHKNHHRIVQNPETFVSEYERWQARFSEPGYAFGKEPNYFLKSCAQLLPRSGRALAIADGEGRNAIWLAEQGLEVLSIDFSPLAQAKARALAAERGVKVNFEPPTYRRGNIPKQPSMSWLRSSRSLAPRVNANRNGRACGGR